MGRPGSMADLLAIQVQADRTGWKRVDPPVLRGSSGVEHRFSVVARSERLISAFEVLDDVGVLEVIAGYASALDTKADVVLVTSSGRVGGGAGEMAAGYGVKILAPGEIERHFDRSVVANGGTGRARNAARG